MANEFFVGKTEFNSDTGQYQQSNGEPKKLDRKVSKGPWDNSKHGINMDLDPDQSYDDYVKNRGKLRDDGVTTNRTRVTKTNGRHSGPYDDYEDMPVEVASKEAYEKAVAEHPKTKERAEKEAAKKAERDKETAEYEAKKPKDPFSWENSDFDFDFSKEDGSSSSSKDPFSFEDDFNFGGGSQTPPDRGSDKKRRSNRFRVSNFFGKKDGNPSSGNTSTNDDVFGADNDEWKF